MTCPTANHQASVAARLALTPDDLRQVYTLRHEAYAEAGYLEPNAASVFTDEYDARSTSRTALLLRDGAPAATVMLCLLSNDSLITDNHGGESLPASRMFGSEIDAYLAARRAAGKLVRTVEITRLARLPGYERDIRLMQALFRVAGYLIISFNADVILATVTKNHAPYYRRMGFDFLVEPRAYPGLAVETILMACSTRDQAEMPGFLPSINEIPPDDAAYWGLLAGETVEVPREQPRSRSTAPQRVAAVVAAL